MPIPPPPLPLVPTQSPSNSTSSPQNASQAPDTALVPQPRQEVVQWNQANLTLLKKTLVPSDITDTEFALFVEVCKRRNLDPFARQIYAVKRGGKLVIQTSIDGYRLIAERSGKYLGQSAPEWCGKEGQWKDVWTGPGNPFACRIGVFKAGHAVPTIAIGYWDTYASVGPFWSKSGPSQLAKCSEALALRKAFPEDLSGIYTAEEMEQADNTNVINVPIEAEEVQPVMVFPKEVVARNTTGALVRDTGGIEYVFPTTELADRVAMAISDGTFLLVNYTVESGRRVVTGLG